tara:strand:- start:107 stop:355 length:249 start_codon:yes stop_codon:yes gene_type:complete
MAKDWKANWDRWYGNPENRAKKRAYSLKRYNEKKAFILEQKKNRIANQTPEETEDRLRKMREYSNQRYKAKTMKELEDGGLK